MDEAELQQARAIGLGCFSAFLGGMSMAMVAVLLGKVVETARGAPSCDGLPICNWYVYAAGGFVIGAISLPFLVLRRLKRGSAARPSPRG
jgi:hypothetical protein